MLVATLAALHALPGPTNPTLAEVEEVGAFYVFFPADVTAPDGAVVVSPTGGTPGNWILQGDTLTLRPIDGVSDDWPRLWSVIMPAAANHGVEVVMLPGLAGENWICASRQQMPSGTKLRGSPKTHVVSSLGNVNLFDAPFDALYTTSGAPIILVTPNVKGTKTITMPASPGPPGTQFFINRAPALLHGAIFTVVSVAGAGPFVVTVDRPVLYDFNAGSTIATIATRPTDIKIHGEGMHVSGTGGFFFEIAGGLRCYVADVVLDGDAGNVATSAFISDTGGNDCLYERIFVNGPFVQAFQIIGETMTLKDSYCKGGAQQGFLAVDAVDVEFNNCNAEGCVGVGFFVTTDGALGDGTPSERIRLIDCKSFGNGTDGLHMNRGAFRVEVRGGHYCYNAGGGCTLLPFAEAEVGDVSFVDVDFSDNLSVGLQTSPGARGISATRIDVSGPAGGTGLQPRGSMIVQGVTSVGNAVAIHGFAGAGASVEISGVELRSAAAGFTGIFVTGAGRFDLAEGHVACDHGGSIGIFSVAGAGPVSVSDFVVDGTAPPANGLLVQSPNTCRVGEACDFDAAAVPIQFSAGSFSSKGQIVATAAAPLVVPWPDLKASDRVTLVPTVLAGVVVANPVVVLTPGAGFAVVSVAGDVSTYNYEVS